MSGRGTPGRRRAAGILALLACAGLPASAAEIEAAGFAVAREMERQGL